MKLEVKNITKSFGETNVLKGISFSVESGKALGLLGRNGAGKTTTIRILMDVFHANSGEITLDGKPFEPRKVQIGYLPEERGLYPKRKVLEQMIYLAMLRGVSRKTASANAKRWLERLEVSQYQDRLLETLSKGNQQKVQLASTLVCDPEIVILDEPFSGLDPVNSQILQEVVQELIRDGKIVIFSSHQMSYVEEFCEDIVVINHGEVALAGNLDKIKEEYGEGHKAVAAVGMESEELEQVLRDKFADQVQVISHNKHHVVIQILSEQDEWQVLSRFKELGIRLRSYGVYEPSLNDIFVSAVGDEETPEEIKEKNNIGTSFSEFEPKQKKGLFGKRG